MTDKTGKFLDSFQPTVKSVIGSFLVGAVLTLGVGFVLLDWRTAGSADVMVRDAVTNAKAELASDICVERFIGSEGAEANLQQLKTAKSWDRGDMIVKSGWIEFTEAEQSVQGAARLCANKLSDLDSIAAADAPKTSG